MSARDARQIIVGILVESCPIRSLMRGSRPCPYFGHDESCATCTYPWEPVAKELIHESKLLLAKEKVERDQRKKDRVEKGEAGKQPL